MKNNQHTWIVVANSAQARIFRLVQFPKMEELSSLLHAESRLHLDRGDGANHAYEAPSTPKQLEMDKFAKQLAAHLTQANQKGEFSRLYLIAAPAFLGALRPHLDAKTSGAIITEVAKDMTEQKQVAIEQHLTTL